MVNKQFHQLDIWAEFSYNGNKFLKTGENLAVETGKEQAIFRFSPESEVFCDEFVPNIKKHNEFIAYLKQPIDTATPIVISISKDGVIRSNQLIFKNE